ncbi:MAG: LuxR C-terminal-related transcriptional regulator [Bacteroidetes bacterium]|nr:LuxR C-terminal-related transcriptional regulator [Bacteroidota bacterium]
MKKIRVLFLSIQPSVLPALLSFFSGDSFITPEFNDIDSFDKNRKKYDVILLDDTTLVNNYDKLFEKIFSAETNNKKILYTSNTDQDFLGHYVFLFDGIISNKVNMKFLKDGIIKTAEGEKYLCSYIKLCLSANSKIEWKLNALTSTEIEILCLIKKGLKNKEIAEKLFICTKTVENHKENIKSKLNLKHVSELFRIL